MAVVALLSTTRPHPPKHRSPIQRGGGSAHRSCRSSRLAVRSEMVPVLLSVLTVDTLRIA